MKLRETHDYIGRGLQQCRTRTDFCALIPNLACPVGQWSLLLPPVVPHVLRAACPPFPTGLQSIASPRFWRSHEEVDVVALHVAGDRVGRADEWSGSGRHGIDRSTGYDARHI